MTKNPFQPSQIFRFEKDFPVNPFQLTGPFRALSLNSVKTHRRAPKRQTMFVQARPVVEYTDFCLTKANWGRERMLTLNFPQYAPDPHSIRSGAYTPSFSLRLQTVLAKPTSGLPLKNLFSKAKLLRSQPFHLGCRG